MKCVIQRVKNASVSIKEIEHASIGDGLLVLVSFEIDDLEVDLDWMATKIVNLRIMKDKAGMMNLSLKETKGDLLLVSQFTLHASTKKGNRPSFILAAKPAIALDFYHNFITRLENGLVKIISAGVFAADMLVSLQNDGPVTIILDSKNKL